METRPPTQTVEEVVEAWMRADWHVEERSPAHELLAALDRAGYAVVGKQVPHWAIDWPKEPANAAT
jgi:hypothetical protein